MVCRAYFLTDEELVGLYQKRDGKLGTFNPRNPEDIDHARRTIFEYLLPWPVWCGFARARDTQCGGRQARRVAGIKSNNIVLVPHDIVVKILNRYYELKPEEALNKALRAQIIMPGGIVVGRCSDQPGRACNLPPQAIPKIALHSSNVEALRDSGREHPVDRTQDLPPLTPYETYDWKAHGDLPLHWFTDNVRLLETSTQYALNRAIALHLVELNDML
ncbi:hypothetical protein RSAG8_11357, partial [Rhizoctonia solani AG-8 WAC10335]